MAEKILARTAGVESVRPGDYITARIDFAMAHESFGGVLKGMMSAVAGNIFDPRKVAIVLDHYSPAPDEKSAAIHRFLTRAAKQMGIENFYGEGYGICHRVLPEEGHVQPGMLIVGADSHTTTYGALGAAATGIGMSEMAYVFSRGKLWFMVPPSIKITFEGALNESVTAKDIILFIAGEWGADFAQYKAIEFLGPGVETLSIEGRMTIANMAVEVGAKFGLFPADDEALNWIKEKTGIEAETFGPDTGAEYEIEYKVDLSTLEPQVAFPHAVDNVRPISEVGEITVDQAVVGGCTNGHFQDLAKAAEILKGGKVHPDVRFLVIPASRKVEIEAVKAGIIETLLEAGAMISPPSCGNCFGNHIGVLAEGQKCVSATNRNFKGRMGSSQAQIYLASPATVAASAITGRITDPRKI